MVVPTMAGFANYMAPVLVGAPDGPVRPPPWANRRHRLPPTCYTLRVSNDSLPIPLPPLPPIPNTVGARGGRGIEGQAESYPYRKAWYPPL